MSDLDLFATVANSFINAFGGAFFAGLVVLCILIWFAIKARLDRTAIVFLGIMFTWSFKEAGFVPEIVFYLAMIIAAVFLYLGLSRVGGGE